MSDNICFVIPIRYNSSRLSKKSLISLDGQTTIQRTYQQVLKSKYYNNNIYIFTDHEAVKEHCSDFSENIVLTSSDCKNGTERISRNLNHIPGNYKYIVNIQSDEPFIDPRNIDFAIEKHLLNSNTKNIFYTTLHQKILDNEYLNSTGCLTVQFTRNNDVMTYSRNVLPGNKAGINDVNKRDYYGFTGIYVFNRDLLQNFHKLEDTYYQDCEDIEQMKILEHGFKIKTYECPHFNEISLNTEEDLVYLNKKYFGVEPQKAKKIKLVIFDLDGVFTDSKIYVNDKGILTKCYNGKDTSALKILIGKGIKTALITAHKTECVNHLKHIVQRMDDVTMGNYKKIDEYARLKNKFDIIDEEIAYIGDDMPDLPCIKAAGFSGCPNDAIKEIQSNVSYVCQRVGGDGAVREFIEKMIELSLI